MPEMPRMTLISYEKMVYPIDTTCVSFWQHH